MQFKRVLETLVQQFNFTPTPLAKYPRGTILHSVIAYDMNFRPSLVPSHISRFLRIIQKQKLIYCKHHTLREYTRDGFNFYSAPFRQSVWLAIGVTFIITGIILLLMSGFAYGLDPVFALFSILLRQDQANSYRVANWRSAFFLLISIMSVTMLALYEACITGEFLVPDKAVVAQDMKSLVKIDGYRIYFPYEKTDVSMLGLRKLFEAGGISEMLEEKDGQIFPVVFGNGEDLNAVEMARLLASEKLSLITTSELAPNLIREWDGGKNGINCFIVPQTVGWKRQGWEFVWHLHAEFRSALEYYRAVGLMDVWYKYVHSLNNAVEKQGQKARGIKLSGRVISIFIILAAGCLGAGLCWGIEFGRGYFMQTSPK